VGDRIVVNPFRPGEVILVVDRRGGRHLVRLQPGSQFHFHDGVIAHDDLLGQEEGVRIETRLGRPVTAYRPRMHDYLLEMPRTSAVVYPKDIAFLLVWGDIFPGARVFEAGVGSGAVAIALLRAIGPTGRLVTYDRRADMIQQAQKNAQAFLGETPNWLQRHRDVADGIADGPYDRIVFDLADPGAVARPAAEALVPGGIVSWFVPNVTQIRDSAEAYQASGCFGEVETYETSFRPWEFRGRTARPVRRMVAHTGFLGMARKTAPHPDPVPMRTEGDEPSES
jgi:tRNA (adenine57-N1/adenine58-N1)-methyltransferase catalytic subunit